MYSVFQNTSISCIHLALGCFPVCFTVHILKILTQTKAVIYELATSVLISECIATFHFTRFSLVFFSFWLYSWNNYYRTAHMHNADGKMSIRPMRSSLTRQYYVKVAKHIIKVFSPSDSQIILVFPYQTGWHLLRQVPPLTGASNAVWYETIFQPISHFISEMMQDRAIVAMAGK